MIPVKALKDSKVAQNAVEAGFDFNSATNGIPLDKALHGSHPNYTNYVTERLDALARKNEGYDGKDARSFIQNELLPYLEKKANEAKSKSQTLQQYFAPPGKK